MASKRQIALTVIGNAKSAIDAIRMTDSTAQKMGRTMASVTKTLGIGFAAVGAAGVYMGKQVFDGAMMAVRGAAEDQKSVLLLEKQIRAATYATDAQIKANEDFIASLQFTAATADSELRPALGNLVRATGNLTDAQSLLKLSLDISAATGKELGAVTMAMGRAATGNVGALARLGIPIDENAKKTKNFNAVVEQLGRTFKGASDTAVATFDGRMRQLRIGVDEAVESIGYALLPFAEKLVTFINNNIVPALQVFASNVGEKGIGKAVSLAIASMGELGDRSIDAMEKMTLGILTAAKATMDLIEKLALAATILGMVTYNASLTFKAIAAGYGSDVAQDKLNDAIKATPALFDKLRTSVKASAAEIDASKQGLGDRTRAQNDSNTSVKDGAGLEDQYGGAVSKSKTEVNKGEEALKDYARQLTTTQSALKSVTSASKELKRADASVAESLATLTKARAKFEQVVRGFGAGSKEAVDKERELAKSQRDLERSGYDVEQAVFAVADAERNLAELRANPEASTQDIREAEIALAEARLAVADATDAQRDAGLSLTEMQRQLDVVVNGAKEGSEEYASALAELEAAQRSYQDAIESQIDAREREAEAIKKVREEEEALAKLRAALPKGTTFDEQGNAIAPTAATGSKFPNFMAAVRALHPNAPALDSRTPVKAARMAFPNLYKEYKEAGLALADGGIVRRATTALIGEAGPEAVIPLRDLGSLGQTNVYVTVNAGLGTDPAVVGDEIVNVLQRYNRRNGALPLKVA